MNFVYPAILRALSAITASIMITGCYSQRSIDDHAEMRRQRLLEMYPVHKTTQKDVETRFGHPAQSKSTRPIGGWDAEPDNWVKTYAARAEKRTGRKIAKVERYFGADGMFSLCYCWFYYDRSNRLLDAEWQWSSD